MGQIKKIGPVKLITGFVFSDESYFHKTKSALERKFGKTDFVSVTLEFSHTDYYETEFGRNLKRKFISFQKLIPAQRLAAIKNITNKLENKLSSGAKRKINIDPGYLDMAKVVLASTKDFNHRIYLDKGIFAEITLFYQDKGFKPREWTYPDYRTPEYNAIFCRIREIYANQIKKQ